MLIQPYIENAVWHGLRYKEKKGYLKVSFTNGDNIKVTIEDNGIGRKRSEEIKTANQRQNKSIGISNIESRLKFINQIYNTKLGVYIEDLDKSNKTGTRVTIELLNLT